MRLDADTLRRLWPRAPQGLIDAVAERSAEVFRAHGLTSALRVAHFMAQISHESGGGTITAENLSYSTPERIAAVWPRRFTPATAMPYVHNPKSLADVVYNGRMGNRPGTSDGFDYRGRGLLQLTGRASYAEIGGLVGLPLEDRPELAAAPTAALAVAAAEFEHLGCLPFCDQDNVEAVTRRVNGGYTGLASRKAWLARWKATIATADATEGPVDAREGHPDATEPPPVQIPRGSDETLPPGVDHPDKTSTQSKTIWAAIVSMVTSGTLGAGQVFDAVKPLLANPTTLALLLGAGLIAGGFIVWDRNQRLRQDRV